MSSQDRSHPYIKFAIDWLEEVGYNKNNGNLGKAIQGMIDFIHTFDPKDRAKTGWKELDEELYKIFQARRSVEDTDPLVLQTKLNAFDNKFSEGYINAWSKLWSILWKSGKLYDRTYQGIDLKAFDLDDEATEVY